MPRPRLGALLHLHCEAVRVLELSGGSPEVYEQKYTNVTCFPVLPFWIFSAIERRNPPHNSTLAVGQLVVEFGHERYNVCSKSERRERV